MRAGFLLILASLAGSWPALAHGAPAEGEVVTTGELGQATAAVTVDLAALARKAPVPTGTEGAKAGSEGGRVVEAI